MAFHLAINKPEYKQKQKINGLNKTDTFSFAMPPMQLKKKFFAWYAI